MKPAAEVLSQLEELGLCDEVSAIAAEFTVTPEDLVVSGLAHRKRAGAVSARNRLWYALSRRGFSLTEIASLFGCVPTTVRTGIARAALEPVKREQAAVRTIAAALASALSREPSFVAAIATVIGAMGSRDRPPDLEPAPAHVQPPEPTADRPARGTSADPCPTGCGVCAEFGTRIENAPIRHTVVEVANAFCVKPDEILGRSRLKTVSRARQRIWARLHGEGWSSTEIAAMFGRDHSTVLAGVAADRLRTS